MISNIPQELKELQQWVCFDVSDDGKKIPYTPGSDSMAASNRPRDWRSFRAACKDVEEGKRQHIGFCFASTDPYVFIDLDDPYDTEQAAVFERFDTYAQRSVSGEGCHIICKGSFEGPGKHPASPHAGIFKENRFCLMTAAVVDDRSTIKVVPDADLQAIHSWLGGGLGDAQEELTEYKQDIPDAAVFREGCQRFDKFESLTRGDWQKYEEYHGDHSTADHAFIAMLCDLTECNDQVRWFFSVSGMWTEERAAKKAGHGLGKYVDRTIRKIRASQARERDHMSRVTLCFDEEEKEPITVQEVQEVPAARTSEIDKMPEGIIKDMARYSMATAFYPLEEAAISSSHSLFTGFSGRAFQTPTRSGLNTWIILVGDTSCGKDEYQSCMNRIIRAREKRGLSSVGKILGGELVSGPALENVFSDRKRYISYMPEFGDMFKTLAAQGAPEHIRTLSRGLLNSYNAAGQGGVLRARRKAQGTETGVDVYERPLLNLAGESTPEALYGNITMREINIGLLQRFTIINVPKTSWSLVENTKNGQPPPKALVDQLEQLVVLCDGMEVEQRRGKDHIVVDGSAQALKYLQEYRQHKRQEIMDCAGGLAHKEVINRAGLKAVRFASAHAVSADFHTPYIDMERAEYGVYLTDKLDKEMIERFSSGDVGSGQTKQEHEIRKAAESLRALDIRQRQGLGMIKEVAKAKDFFPLSVLKDRVVHGGSFTADRVGAVTAFERCVEALVRSGTLNKVGEEYAANTFGHTKGVLLCLR